MLKKDGLYLAYLRKSREDREAELHGMGDTLLRHEKMIQDLASYNGIQIARWYREVVSGDTIAARPQMIQLLNDIEELNPDGVLVVEIERLARGDTRDQGMIMETFKYAGTLIITPAKVYDPNNEFDEEYAEFGLFMSRREYKTINRRLQRGRIQSFHEGKWTGNRTPYGYTRVKIPNEKGFMLQIRLDQAETVKAIFRMYLHGTPDTGGIPIGPSRICHVLDDLHILAPSGEHWQPCTIRRILGNPVYVGKVQSGYRKTVRKTVNGTVTRSRPINQNPEVREGLHPPIIDLEEFQAAGKKRKSSYRKPCFTEVKNPLAGLIYCAECGQSMYRRPAGERCLADVICCRTHGCPTHGSYYSLIEERLLETLAQWLKDYKVTLEHPATADLSQLDFLKAQEPILEETLSQSKLQLSRAMELLERDIYTVEMFQERAAALNETIGLTGKKLLSCQAEINRLELARSSKDSLVPRFERVLSLYPTLESGAEKNALLKEVLNRVEYSKTVRGDRSGKNKDQFTLKIYPKL